MNGSGSFPIGTPGQPWGEAERTRWRQSQQARRSHAAEVLARIDALPAVFERVLYGELDYPPQRYPLLALRAGDGRRPLALVTGGVHGYETSGVQGALDFLAGPAQSWLQHIDLLVVPCVSPWAYERIQRWNPQAVDPNRSFREPSPAPEAAALMRLVAPQAERVLLHIDLHETTDSDESEFRPALAARDGKAFEPGSIPDGFYAVGDSERPEPGLHAAIIEAVAKVTHIAPADERGELIGSPMVAPGVILYPCRQLGLCAGMTPARFVCTTEVYPDSPRATPEQCNRAQVAAVCAALGHALAATA